MYLNSLTAIANFLHTAVLFYCFWFCKIQTLAAIVRTQAEDLNVEYRGLVHHIFIPTQIYEPNSQKIILIAGLPHICANLVFKHHNMCAVS